MIDQCIGFFQSANCDVEGILRWCESVAFLLLIIGTSAPRIAPMLGFLLDARGTATEECLNQNTWRGDEVMTAAVKQVGLFGGSEASSGVNGAATSRMTQG